MIVITGATGALNGATVDHLLERVPASEVAVVASATSRRPSPSPSAASRSAAATTPTRPRFPPRSTAPTSSCSSPRATRPRTRSPCTVRPSTPLSTAGVGRILYTSHQAAAPDNPFAPGRDHFATEQLLAASGVPWTSLRNGFYAHSLGWLAGPWRETGVMAVPGDGPVSWTAREDAAEAAAVILASDGAYDGPTTITAPAAPTFAELAEVASELVGPDHPLPAGGRAGLARRPGRRRAAGVHGAVRARLLPGGAGRLLRRHRPASRRAART